MTRYTSRRSPDSTSFAMVVPKLCLGADMEYRGINFSAGGEVNQVRHVKVWWSNQHFWTMIGMAVFVILNGMGVFTVSGDAILALGGVTVAYIIFDTLRDMSQNKNP